MITVIHCIVMGPSSFLFFLAPSGQVMSELNVIATEMKLDVLEADEGMDAEAAAEHTKKREEKVARKNTSPG